MVDYYKGKIGVEDIQFGNDVFLRYDKDLNTAQKTEVSIAHLIRPDSVAFTASAVLVPEYQRYSLNNEGSSGDVTLTLPKAVASRGPFEFLVVEEQTLIIDPDSTDYFRDCAAGKYKYSNVPGNLLRVWCIMNSIWEYSYQLVSGNWDNEA